MDEETGVERKLGEKKPRTSSSSKYLTVSQPNTNRKNRAKERRSRAVQRAEGRQSILWYNGGEKNEMVGYTNRLKP